jgi:hypothetical protein
VDADPKRQRELKFAGLDAPGMPMCTSPHQLKPGQPPAVKIVVLNNQGMRKLSATVLYWRTSLNADEIARVKPDLA